MKKKIGNLMFPLAERHFMAFGAAVEHYQKPQRDFAMTVVEDFDVCIDVGAHVGIFSRHFAQRFKKVIAFEPINILRSCLFDNVPDNVVLRHEAVGDSCRTASIRRVALANSGCSFIADDQRLDPQWFASEQFDGHELVRMITIDSLELDSLGLIKIDVQGYEALVLRGAMATLDWLHPVVLIEEKPLGGPLGPQYHIEEIHSILISLGYTRNRQVGGDRIHWRP